MTFRPPPAARAQLELDERRQLQLELEHARDQAAVALAHARGVTDWRIVDEAIAAARVHLDRADELLATVRQRRA